MNRFKTLLAASTMLAAAGSAHATLVTTTSVYAPTALPGTATPIVLTGITPPSSATITTGAYSVQFTGLSANQGIVQGTTGGLHAIPVAGATPPTAAGTPEYLTGDYGSALTTDPASSGNYFSTGAAGGTITITFNTAQDSFALLWGSVDTSNNLEFFNGSTDLGGVTGASVQASPGFTTNGAQGPGGSVYVVINDVGGTFTKVVESSGVVSFENASVVGSTAPISTPEPVSMALLGSGLVGIGLLRKSRRA